MDNQYREIRLDGIDGAEGFECTESKNADSISNLKMVNLFVGPNNLGKSRFMRALIRAEKFEYRVSLPTTTSNATQIPLCIELALQYSTRSSEWRREHPAQALQLERINRFVSGGRDLCAGRPTWLREGTSLWREIANEVERIDTIVEPKSGIGLNLQNISGLERNPKDIRGLESSYPTLRPIDPRIYIPTLRGLRPFKLSDTDKSVDVYEKRTRQDYAIPIEKSIFTGLTMYDDLQDLMLGTQVQRDRVTNYEAFLTKHVFDNQTVQLVPRLKQDAEDLENDVVYVKIGDQEERPIYSLGDGVQSLIILTFRAFTAEKRSLFFIEEPETHLHPGMQRKLLELLTTHENLNRHQYFATTHSNHLLDMVGEYKDCATFLYRREKKDTVKIQSVGSRERKVLHELGARASSVFLTNATIWVEGPTDGRYLREYLRKYLELNSDEPKWLEDTHYSFMQAGGANLWGLRL